MLFLSILLLTIHDVISTTFEGTDSDLGAFNINIGDVETVVTLTFEADAWIGLGFGGLTMDGVNTVIYSATGTEEFTLIQHKATDEQKIDFSWTIDEETMVDSIFILKLSRNNDVYDTFMDAFVFDPASNGINLIWAKGSSLTRGYHPVRTYDQYLDVELATDDNVTVTSEPIESDVIDVEVLVEHLKPFFDIGPKHKLIATAVRLAFHDCGGPISPTNNRSICDGCVDHENPDHGGLVDFAIDILEDVYINSGYDQNISRADFWHAAATLALKYAQLLDTDHDVNERIQNLPIYIGREDCETDSSDAGDVSAEQKAVPKLFPNPKGSFQMAAEWFAREMGFTTRETVALLGVHTLGVTHPAGSGFGFSSVGSFWVPGWDELDNDFYVALLTGFWAQQSNSDGLFQWFGKSNTMMLNADFGMVYDLEAHNCDSTDFGECECAIPACSNGCSHSVRCNNNTETLTIVEEFADPDGGNEVWLEEFADVYLKMITMGYEEGELEILAPIETTEFFTTAESETTEGMQGTEGTEIVVGSTETPPTDTAYTCSNGFVVVFAMVVTAMFTF